MNQSSESRSPTLPIQVSLAGREPLCPALISPWSPNADLGSAYNHWITLLGDRYRFITFMDHDGELLHRDWFDVLLRAIARNEGAGMFTCAVNQLKPYNKGQSIGEVRDLNTRERLAVATSRRVVHGFSVRQLLPTKPEYAAGFFMCVSVDAVRSVGGFKAGFAGVDWDIHARLHEAQFPTYMIPGLLFWHRHRDVEDRGEREIPTMKTGVGEAPEGGVH